MENNGWIVGDDEQVLVIDAAREPDLIAEAFGDRPLVGIVCTHAHSGHVDAAVELSELTGAPILPHRDDLRLWHDIYPDRTPLGDLTDGRETDVAGAELTVRHTPGHTPGSVSLYDRVLHTVFTGDTPLSDGSGMAGREGSDFPRMINSVRERLISLPADTVVCPGPGDVTTVGRAGQHVNEWVGRGP
ncbi:MBL fold metallo-hydrolase [Streptomyces spiralis]|uniref:MBL fold metallo-hydrolase n=1 Tax=Streptomyces spiralis TaxID=66376 RepID=UPI0036CF4299